MVRAVVRLVLMVLVMAAVLVTTTAVGLPTAAVLGLSIIVAGLAGMIGLARRSSALGAAGVAADRPAEPNEIFVRPSGGTVDAQAVDPDMTADPVVAAMAPDAAGDAESLLPRWRRPSLIAARKADPTRVVRMERTPRRFSPAADPSPNRRVVRYAVVTLLDRADEVLGRPISDLLSGDEVEVLDNGGAFWEVLCPDGLRGWVHRTTLAMPAPDQSAFGHRVEVAEPDDILTAVLSARGIH